jgi:uncharacterized protein
VKLPRTPGERESRWMHLLCGEVAISAAAALTDEAARGVRDESAASSEIEALKAEQKRLADEVIRLQALVQHMAAELGISLDGVAPPQS